MTNSIDYSKNENWASLPDTNKAVDVFYVYPTVYLKPEPKNMDIGDPTLRKNVSGLLTAQAGVYSPYANLFAPYYRQQTAATQSMKANNGGVSAYEDPSFKIGYRDIQQAFYYYLAHLNKGRPFILAGHSQGSMVIIQLLRNRFENPQLQQQLIAAYAIGYSLTKEDLANYPWMRLAQKEDDTGVIITYNTQGPNAGESPVLLKNAVAINPLNWKTDATLAPQSANKGAVFFNDATGEVLQKIPNFTDAKIDTTTGALIVCKMQPTQTDKINLKKMGRWPSEVYHRYDYAFFYENIKENVEKRIKAFQKNRGKL